MSYLISETTKEEREQIVADLSEGKTCPAERDVDTEHSSARPSLK